MSTHADSGFDGDVMLVQVSPNQSQRLMVSNSKSNSDPSSFQIMYQQVDIAGKSQAPKTLQLKDVLDFSAVYRGVHPVSFNGMLSGFVLLVGQDDVGEMQGFLFVWNGTAWHHEPATNVLLTNLTAQSDVDVRLDKVFPYNGLGESVKLMTVQNVDSAKQVLGDVFFPEVRVSSQSESDMLVLAKVDTGSAAVFLLESSATGLTVHRLPSPMDSAAPLACRPLKASLRKCGVNEVASLSIAYNCQSATQNQGEAEIDLFEKHKNVWVLKNQLQPMCDQKNRAGQ